MTCRRCRLRPAGYAVERPAHGYWVVVCDSTSAWCCTCATVAVDANNRRDYGAVEA